MCGAVVALTSSLMALTVDQAPAGFTALYNGRDLTGWRGGDTFDHRKLMAMNEAERTAKIASWNATMRAHWSAQGPELVNDGEGAYATTEKDYGDFELRLEYRTVAKADSGIYLRGVPQVQIWDYTDDAKFNQWNTVRIVMVGSRVSVWLNSVLVVDHAIMENYYDRATPVPARGPIQLQTHGGEIRWRSLFIREIPSTEANDLLRSKGAQGFADVFNGRNFSGWAGALDSYEIRDDAIACKPEKGGTIYWNRTLTDFDARVEFKLPAGGNNGLAIRYPGTGDTAYVGMTELQVLDDNYEQVRGPIDPRQAHGSAYGMVAAARGYQRPIGEWNVQDVQVVGSTIRVELNGTVILKTDLSKVDPATYMAGSAHPGVARTEGFFGFAGHNDPVMFRRVQIRERSATSPKHAIMQR